MDRTGTVTTTRSGPARIAWDRRATDTDVGTVIEPHDLAAGGLEADHVIEIDNCA